MCWIGNLSDKRIAKCDFFAYKVLMKHKKSKTNYFSPFMGEQYWLGKPYLPLPIPISPKPVHTNGNCRIEEGLHCYSQENIVTIYKNNCGLQILTPHGLNVQIYSSYAGMTPVIVKCIIPEGTTYYNNINGEIVTEEMIIKEEIFLPEGSVKRFKNIK